MATSDQDWGAGPAKWVAVLVLGVLGAGALGWSLGRGGREPMPLVVATPATPAPTPPPVIPREVAHAPPAEAPVQASTIPTSPAQRAESAERRTPKSTPVLTKKINLNTGTAAELELLPGIGPALAQRIIDYRETRGRFASIDELDAVKGIGPKLMARVREHVTVEEAPAPPAETAATP